MKILAAVLAATSLSFTTAPAPTVAQEPAPTVAQEPTFMEKFRQAMRINARDEMKALVKKHQSDAVAQVRLICMGIAGGGNDRLEAEIAALGQAWRDAFQTEFVDIQYEYFSLLRPELKEERRRLNVRYDQAYKKYVTAEAKNEIVSLPGIGMEMKGAAEAIEGVGDHYIAALAWIHYGLCFGEKMRGADADLKRECEGYKRAVAACDKIQLRDVWYHDAKLRYQALERAGYGEAGAEADPGAGPAGPTAGAGVATTLATTFEVMPDIESIRRPNYLADSLYPVWTNVYLTGKGSTADFFSIAEGGPKAIRVSAAKVVLDTDGDGEGDVDVPLTGRITPVELELGEGESKRKWAFLATLGGQRETFQGFERNLEPGDAWMSIYIAPAASLVTTIGDTPVRIIDDNMDSLYGSVPLEWGHPGTVEESYQRDLDSVVIGSAKRALPWSEYLEVGEGWYRMTSEAGGNRIVAEPVEVETGTLKLAYKGGWPDYLVVKGENDFEQSYYDIASNKGGVQVPVGRYELFVGRLSKGKRGQMMKALILPSRNTPAWTVSSGEKVTVELGAPFTLDFASAQDEETITVVGRSVNVLGRGQESYQRLWNCVLAPEASERPAGGRRGSKPEKMRSAASQEDLRDKGEEYAWYPYDLILTKKKVGVDAEVQLTVKKNKLFGKLESPWKN